MRTMILPLLLTWSVSLCSQNANTLTTSTETTQLKDDDLQNRRNLRFPIINHDALWYMLTVGEGPEWQEEYSFMYFDKDSVEIEGKYYFPLMQVFEAGNKPPQMLGYFREAGSITYKYVDENSEEYLVEEFSVGEYIYFDFGAEVGDSAVAYGNTGIVDPIVEQVGTMTDLEGDERIHLSIGCAFGGVENSLIEGIGDEIDGLFGPYWYCASSHYTPWLVCYSENAVVKYTSFGLDADCMTTVSTSEHFSLNIKVFPNPTAGLVTVQGIAQSTEMTIYNVQGVRLWTRELHQDESLDLGFLPNGIYIAKLRQGQTTESVRLVKLQ
jgi:hypothetical protein